MKISTHIVVGFALLLATHTYTQKKEWYNKDLELVSKDKALYFKQIQKKRNKSIVVFSYKNGNPYREYTYKNGKKNGKFLEFYETGELKIEGSYSNNLKNGVWKVYYKKGKIKEKGKYNNGEKVGIWKIFYKNILKN